MVSNAADRSSATSTVAQSASAASSMSLTMRMSAVSVELSGDQTYGVSTMVVLAMTDDASDMMTRSKMFSRRSAVKQRVGTLMCCFKPS